MLKPNIVPLTNSTEKDFSIGLMVPFKEILSLISRFLFSVLKKKKKKKKVVNQVLKNPYENVLSRNTQIYAQKSTTKIKN